MVLLSSLPGSIRGIKAIELTKSDTNFATLFNKQLKNF